MQILCFCSKTNRMHQCLKFVLFWNNSAHFGRSFRPSSGVHDCTYSNRHLSNRYCCLLASNQLQYLFGCCVYSRELLMMDGKTVRNARSYSKIKQIWDTGASGWFYCRNTSRCTGQRTSNTLFIFGCISAWKSLAIRGTSYTNLEKNRLKYENVHI